jgi:hypothetical protein
MNDPDRGHPATDRCSRRCPRSENSAAAVLTAGLDIDALTAVAEAATPGPWRMNTTPTAAWVGFDDKAGFFAIVRDANWGTRADLAHIATANPETVLRLIAEAREARRLRGEVAALADGDRIRGLIRDNRVKGRQADELDADLRHVLRALIGGE